jgi:hypothetical protein
MALAPGRSNIKVAGISEWAIKDTARPDTGYGIIPFLSEGKVEIKTLETANTKGQPIPYGYELMATAKFPAVKTQANFMDLFGDLSSKLIDHRITLVNGQVISSKPGTSTPSPTGFGVKWKFTSDKDMDGNQFVEITASRRLTVAEYTQILTSVNADLTAAVAADTFYAFGSLARTDVVPAGISKVELGAASAGTYLDDIDNIRNGKFTAELLTTKDSRGQDIGFAIQLNFEIEGLETAQAELLKWDDIAIRANECRITFISGAILTMADHVGISYAISTDKDTDDVAVIKIKGSGRILITDWNGLWT